MGSMTVQGMYDYVRTFLDSDEEDLPDSLLSMWLNEGVDRIRTWDEPWSFYEQDWTVTFGAEQDLDELSPVPEAVMSVEGDRWLLKYRPHERQVGKYAWSSATAGNTTEWSLFDRTVFLWPVPAAPATYVLRGYRQPTAADSVDDVVDLPREFDALICEWILTRAYEWQDDDVMSQQKLARFERDLDRLRRRYVRAPKAGVQRLGGEHDGPVLLDRFAYSWEW
jgi:hypothetical protein